MYYMVIDQEDVEFDIYQTDGKSIARAYDELALFCQDNGLQEIDGYVSMAEDDFDEFTGGMEIEEKWYEATLGIVWLSKLLEQLQEQSPAFMDDYLITDLESWLELLYNAKKINAKWHLSIDF